MPPKYDGKAYSGRYFFIDTDDNSLADIGGDVGGIKRPDSASE